jgi:hypothetical protein
VRDRLDALALSLLLLVVGWLHRAALSLPLRNADDWYHVDIAAGLLAGDADAFVRATAGTGMTDALRPLPWPLWVVDYALFGLDGSGYYATNLLLHLLIVAGVYALARRLGGGVGSGLVAGSVVGLNIATGQGTWYLAARYDQCMVVLILALVLLWPRLRETGDGRVGAVVLFAAACLCKPTALAALPVLMVVDRRESPWTRWGPFVAVAAGYLVLLKLSAGAFRPVLGGGGGWGGAPVEALWMLVAPGHALGVPSRSLEADLLLWIVPAFFGVAILAVRGVSGRLVWTGIGWLVVTLPLPLLYLSTRSGSGPDWGRQMLLPSVGLALLAGACAPKEGVGPRAGANIGLLVLLVFGLTFNEVGPHFLERGDPTLERFVAATRGHSGRLVVVLQRPGGALSSLLTSGVIARVTGGEPPVLALQGGESGFVSLREGYGYGATKTIDFPAGPVLAESYGPPGEAPEAWPTFVPWRPRVRELGGVAQQWDFSAGAAGWGPWPKADRGHLGLPKWTAGEGFVVDASIRMPEGEVARQLALENKPGILLSPTLEIATAEVCGIELQLDANAIERLPSLGTNLVRDGRFAVVTWSARDDWRDGWRGIALAPIGPDGRARVRLDRSLPWTEQDVVRRLGVLASNGPGRVVIQGLSVQWCE